MKKIIPLITCETTFWLGCLRFCVYSQCNGFRFSVAILAQAITCSNVRGVFPFTNVSGFCLVQVSTTQFCSFSFLMARVSDGTNVRISLAPASSSNMGGIAHLGTAVGQHSVHVHLRGLKSTPCISTVIRRPWAMGPEGPSGCGAVTMSEYVPRSC